MLPPGLARDRAPKTKSTDDAEAPAASHPVVAAAPVRRPARPTGEATAASPAPGTQAAGGYRYAELINNAKRAYGSGDYPAALGYSNDALVSRPGDQDALSVAAMSACKLSKADLASGYVRRLKGNRQTMVRQLCLSQNVAVR